MRRLFVMLALVGALLLMGTTWLDSVRASTTTPTPNGLHAFATTAPGGAFSPYPKRHVVEMEPVGGRVWDLGLTYARKAVMGGGFVEEGGEYRMPSGVIRIVSEQVRFEASLPAGLRPDFDRTVRHEYGHAFLCDLLADKVGLKTKRGQQLMLETIKDSPNPDLRWPSGLGAVVREYRHVSRNVYMEPYYTSDFGEYLAESFARFGSGQSVPPETRKFLAKFVH